MIYWAQLLHFYQPPTQTYGVLDQICNECYRPLLEVFRAFPYARATVNINGILTEQLLQTDHKDVVHNLAQLAERGQIEFTGSAKYHAILPLMYHEEVRRQIRRNHVTNQQAFGNSFSPRGFFPPEMCFSREIAQHILDTGHQWVILSGVANPLEWPQNIIYEMEVGGERLAVFFRDDILSNKISFKSLDSQSFIQSLEQLAGKEDVYVVTAMDAETYGHHIPHWEQLFLADVFERIKPKFVHSAAKGAKEKSDRKDDVPGDENGAHPVTSVLISQLQEFFPKGPVVDPRPSSWSTTADDIKDHNYYPLWKDPRNIVHKYQWQHLNIASALTQTALQKANNPRSRHFAYIARFVLDQAFHSDQFWWANKSPRWEINLILKGLNLQKEVIANAYKAIATSDIPEEDKTQMYYRVAAARDLDGKITDLLLWTER